MPRSIQAVPITNEPEITDPAHLIGLKVGKLAKRIVEIADRAPDTQFSVQRLEEDHLASALLDMMEAQLTTVRATSLPGMLAQAIQIDNLIDVLAHGDTERIKKDAEFQLRLICYSLVNGLEELSGVSQEVFGGEVYYMGRATNPHAALARILEGTSSIEVVA
jgi:hypothetical protein